MILGALVALGLAAVASGASTPGVSSNEILIGGSAVANLIREKKTFQIYSIIQTGRAQGMVTLNDSLITLFRNKIIDTAEAYRLSANKSEMAALLAREGQKVVPVDV